MSVDSHRLVHFPSFFPSPSLPSLSQCHSLQQRALRTLLKPWCPSPGSPAKNHPNSQSASGCSRASSPPPRPPPPPPFQNSTSTTPSKPHPPSPQPPKTLSLSPRKRRNPSTARLRPSIGPAKRLYAPSCPSISGTVTLRAARLWGPLGSESPSTRLLGQAASTANGPGCAPRPWTPRRGPWRERRTRSWRRRGGWWGREFRGTLSLRPRGRFWWTSVWGTKPRGKSIWVWSFWIGYCVCWIGYLPFFFSFFLFSVYLFGEFSFQVLFCYMLVWGFGSCGVVLVIWVFWFLIRLIWIRA